MIRFYYPERIFGGGNSLIIRLMYDRYLRFSRRLRRLRDNPLENLPLEAQPVGDNHRQAYYIFFFFSSVLFHTLLQTL
ncbi:hypothetical protein KQX54_021206 [Cotesia glomerata]|uniref:Uncharacterized protein n=1 Tax=Cotesia glomerata TaxID=32391 RepID=A0AAV7I0Y8_COTGL|nr:hypothetical protein KQX54_021206 [Cotesia glomerata]